MKIAILILWALTGNYSSAQETIKTEIKTPLEQATTNFKLKMELKSSTNGFSDKIATNHFRLRLDPSTNIEDWNVGFRQDIKNKYTKGQDEYTLDNTRIFAGKIYSAGEFQINPRMEAWLPTNVKEQEKLSYQGSPGFAVKIKRKVGMWTGNLETNARKQIYETTKDTFASWIVYNELKNEIKFARKTYANINLKVDDSWDMKGQHSQRYLFEQGIGFKVADNFDLEVGHLVEKPLLHNNRSDSFVGYDKDFSQVYTQLSYVY